VGKPDKPKVKWRPKTSWEHKPTKGGDLDPYAVTYLRTDGKRDARITIEFVAGGEKQATRQRAITVLRSFIYRDEIPPRRVRVGRDGSVMVMEPGEGGDEQGN
jgi:hypothetical protein